MNYRLYSTVQRNTIYSSIHTPLNYHKSCERRMLSSTSLFLFSLKEELDCSVKKSNKILINRLSWFAIPYFIVKSNLGHNGLEILKPSRFHHLFTLHLIKWSINSNSLDFVGSSYRYIIALFSTMSRVVSKYLTIATTTTLDCRLDKFLMWINYYHSFSQTKYEPIHFQLEYIKQCSNHKIQIGPSYGSNRLRANCLNHLSRSKQSLV